MCRTAQLGTVAIASLADSLQDAGQFEEKRGSATGWNEAESGFGRRVPIEVGQADLDERPDRVFQARFPREFERLLVTLAHLVGTDALLQPVVAGNEQMLDARANVLGHRFGYSRRRDAASSRRLARPRLVRPPGADSHALRSRRRLRRHGLHPRVAGRDAYRRAQPHASDDPRRDDLLRRHGRALPASQVSGRTALELPRTTERWWRNW